ncbi:MAG TPA: aminotransferase class IV [Gemmata sp.]
MNAPLAYLNGRFMPFTDAALPLHDAGFVSGATIVDNARTFRHKLFRWADHLARFRRDGAACYVPLHVTDEHITAAAEELVAHNAKRLPPGGELQLVTFATPGPLGFYLGEPQNGPPTLGMVTYPLPFARYRRFFTEGVTLGAVANVWSAPGALVPPTVKHRSRIAWHVADHRARAETRNPAALALAVDNGRLTETSVANVLVVLGGDVVIPPPGTVLDGISLKTTRELCRAGNVRLREAPIAADDVARASEMLLVGTGFCIAGVRELVGGRACASRTFDWPGPVLTELRAAWSELVGVDIAEQFTDPPGGT